MAIKLRRCMLLGGSHTVLMTSIYSILSELCMEHHNSILMAYIFMIASRCAVTGRCLKAATVAAAETPFSNVTFIAYLWVLLLLQSNTLYQAHCLSIAAVRFFLFQWQRLDDNDQIAKKTEQIQIRTNFSPRSFTCLCIEGETRASMESSTRTIIPVKEKINKNELTSQMYCKRNDMREESERVPSIRLRDLWEWNGTEQSVFFCETISLINNKNRWQGNW